jgi:hypothetical protein
MTLDKNRHRLLRKPKFPTLKKVNLSNLVDDYNEETGDLDNHFIHSDSDNNSSVMSTNRQSLTPTTYFTKSDNNLIKLSLDLPGSSSQLIKRQQKSEDEDENKYGDDSSVVTSSDYEDVSSITIYYFENKFLII